MKPMPESDDLDALLTRADNLTLYLAAAYNGISFPPSFDEQRRTAREIDRLIKDLVGALRECRADYLAALDVIARLTEGWEPTRATTSEIQSPASAWWNHYPDPGEPMSEREWRVFCEAARRNHRSRT